jgi:TonB family protein
MRSRVRNLSIAPVARDVRAADAAAPGRSREYFEAVGAILHGRWQQPTAAEVDGGRPTAEATITVRADGAVASASITRGSDSQAMDVSVRRLLAGLDRLPAFTEWGIDASTLTITVVFELD